MAPEMHWTGSRNSERKQIPSKIFLDPVARGGRCGTVVDMSYLAKPNTTAQGWQFDAIRVLRIGVPMIT